MTATVSDFLKSKSVKKYGCGPESQIARKLRRSAVILAAAFCVTGAAKAQEKAPDSLKIPRTVHVVNGSDTIGSVRCIPQDSASFSRLQRIMSLAAKTTTGQKAIKNMEKHRTTITMTPLQANTMGCYYPSSNMICINTAGNDLTAPSTLAHEASHMTDFKECKLQLADLTYDSQSLLMMNRATEAKAFAAQTILAYELREHDDGQCLDAVYKKHPKMVISVMKNAKNYGTDSAEALRQTTLKFYENESYVDFYDNHIIKAITNNIEKASKASANQMMLKACNVSDFCKTMFSQNGACYMTTEDENKILPTTLSTTAKTALENANKKLQKKGKHSDSSVSKMTVQQTNELLKAARLTKSR